MKQTRSKLTCSWTLLVTAFSCIPSLAQPTLQVLDRDKLILVPGLPSGMTMKPAKCDDSGNTYVRYYDRVNSWKSPIIRISPNGSEIVKFSFSDLKEKAEPIQGLRVADFVAVGTTLYLLSSDDSGLARVLIYKPDGSLSAKVSLNADIFPEKFGAFSDGNFFVMGRSLMPKGTEPGTVPPTPKSISAIFDASGQFLRKVDFKNPVLEIKSSKAEDSLNVDLALVESAPDGVYLLPYSAKPELFVISSAGEIQRHLSLWSPGPAFHPGQMNVNSAEVLVEYVDQQPGQNVDVRYVVYNAMSGDILSYFKQAEDVGGSFSCYDWRGGFNFVTSDQNRRVILRARAK